MGARRVQIPSEEVLGGVASVVGLTEPHSLAIQVPSEKVIGDYLCRLGGPKYLLRRYVDKLLIICIIHLPYEDDAGVL